MPCQLPHTKKAKARKNARAGLTSWGTSATVLDMDIDTIRRLNEEHRQTRGAPTESFKLRLPRPLGARLRRACKSSGLTQTEIIVAGLAVALPPETSIAARPDSNMGAAGAGADAVSAPARDSEDV